MRNLLNVIESIMSGDDQVTSQAEQDTRAVKIVQCFCKIFKGMYQAKDSKYDTNSDYVAGRIPITNYSKDKYQAEVEMRRDVKLFFKLIKSELPKAECKLKITTNSYGKIMCMKQYRLLITINSGTSQAIMYGLTITVDEKPNTTKETNESELNYIRVVVGNDDIKKIFNQLVK